MSIKCMCQLRNAQRTFHHCKRLRKVLRAHLAWTCDTQINANRKKCAADKREPIAQCSHRSEKCCESVCLSVGQLICSAWSEMCAVDCHTVTPTWTPPISFWKHYHIKQYPLLVTTVQRERLRHHLHVQCSYNSIRNVRCWAPSTQEHSIYALTKLTVCA